MVPRICCALLLLCAATRFLGWLCLGTPQEKLETPLELRTPQKEELQEQLEGSEAPVHPSLQPPVLDETLITNGQLRVAQLMEDIAQRMGNVSSHGATGLREGHRVVLSSLHQAQERAQDVHPQLESDVALLLAQQHQMEEVMEKLQRVNQSLGLVLVAVEGARNRLENHLQDLHAVLDPTGRSPSAISTCVLHGFVLLVGLLVLKPPHAILLFLLFLVSSTLGELLGIPALSALLVLAVAGQWLVMTTHRGAYGAWPVFPCHQLTSTPNREHKMELLQEELDRMEMSCLEEPSCLEQLPAMTRDLWSLEGKMSPVPGGQRTKLSSCGGTPEQALGARKHWEPKPHDPNQSLASDVSLMSPRSPCQGLTKAGQRCRKKATPGQDFCHVHATN
ncbi:protein brambleberry-like [Apus apus]|uniref:protein brambleberry-like n=1 Tax=Apus apus TaxID=8895 RepID=UPI0021F8C7BA|nr:protein brambleberry-like [Apus apus]